VGTLGNHPYGKLETNPLPHNKNIPRKNTCFFMRAFVFCFLIGRVGTVAFFSERQYVRRFVFFGFFTLKRNETFLGTVFFF
jgi:hypothetical protein